MVGLWHWLAIYFWWFGGLGRQSDGLFQRFTAYDWYILKAQVSCSIATWAELGIQGLVALVIAG